MLLHPLPNAIMTVIMAVLAIYWLFSFLFGVGLDGMDFDFGFDGGVDAGAEMPDVETDVSGKEIDSHSDHSSESGFVKFLKFVNIGKVPFMLVFSIFKCITWIATLVTTQFIVVESWGWKSVFILIPLFGIGFILTKFATSPMVKFFKEIGFQGEDSIDFLGRSGRMLSTIQNGKIGSAEIFIEKNPMRLNVISLTGEELKYGDPVMVADESDDRKIYYVVREETL